MYQVRLALVLAALILSSCAADLDGRSGEAIRYLKSEDPGLRWVGDWTVICLGGQPNAVGRVELRGHCRIQKYDFTAVARIDRDGPAIITARPAHTPCDFFARHAAVDQQPIEDLSLSDQVARLSTGRVFARERQEPWPYCTIRVEQTSLADFAEAYTAMLDRWQTFQLTVKE